MEKLENDSTEQFYDQSEGMEILEEIWCHGNEPHIAGLSLETPNRPDFIEGIILIKTCFSGHRRYSQSTADIGKRLRKEEFTVETYGWAKSLGNPVAGYPEGVK